MDAKVINPVKVKRITSDGPNPLGMGVVITWSNGAQTELSSQKLRTNCPCASCSERRGESSHENPLKGRRSALKVIQHGLEEELNLMELWPVGKYALGIRWGDRHDSGIYSYSILRALAFGSDDFKENEFS